MLLALAEAGIGPINYVYLTPDGQSYVYIYDRALSTLYLTTGLR